MADYIPKIGDVVLALGQDTAKFTVIKIHQDEGTANLKMIGANRRMTNIPWQALTLIEGKTPTDFGHN
jgi:hypothetical protein